MMDHDHEVDDRSGHSYDDVNVDDPPLTRDDVHRDVYDDFYCGGMLPVMTVIVLR